MGFAVFHASKGKGAGGGLGNHIDRKKGKEHTYKHADENRSHLNLNFKLSNNREKMTLNEAISDRLKEGYNGKRKLRTDAVKYLSHVYTGSHKEMKRIFSDEKLKNEWLKANATFISEEFGAKNIVRLSLHLDEKTPHLHAVTVPLTKDGRLSAKEIMGNKKAMEQRQDRYAEKMKYFGLERGLRRTGIKHENANDYYKRIEKAREMEEENTLEPIKGFFGIDKAKTIEKQQEALKTLYLALAEKSIQEEKNSYLVKKAFDLDDSHKKELQRLKDDIWRTKQQYSKLEKMTIEKYKDIILNPEKTNEMRKRLLTQEKNRGFNLRF